MQKKMTEQSQHMPYEGAGFLLSFRGAVILGERIKKEKDFAKDPTIELEYIGGKIEENADKNDPLNTAYAELVEELGADILDYDWPTRAQIVHIFQLFSKKWIWCFRLELTADEYMRLFISAKELAEWPVHETRDFSKLTGRDTPARKALSRLVLVSMIDLSAFNEFPTQNEGNRMKDAKDFRKNYVLCGRDILDRNVKVLLPLRAFNTVMFSENSAAVLE